MNNLSPLQAWRNYCQAQYNRTKHPYWEGQLEAADKRLGVVA